MVTEQSCNIPNVLQTHPHYMEKLLRSFWVRSWSEDNDVHTDDDIAVVARSAGMGEEEIGDCLAAMKCEAVKTDLKVGAVISFVRT